MDNDENTTELNSLSNSVAEMLGYETVSLDEPLSQIGIDSLNVVELILICQQIYVNCVNFEGIEIDENTTLREIDAQLMDLSV